MSKIDDLKNKPFSQMTEEEESEFSKKEGEIIG